MGEGGKCPVIVTIPMCVLEITDREAAAAGDSHREGEGISWMVGGIGRD